MQRFTNEIYSIIKPLQYIRINDFYASHLFYFRSKKTHTSPNSDAYLYIPKQMQAMQTTIAIHYSLHDIQYMFAMIEWLNLNIHTILSTVVKPMDWLQCHCGWCHMVNWCYTWDNHGKTMISSPGNLAFSCVSDFQYQMGEWPSQVFWD